MKQEERFSRIADFINSLYGEGAIPLHRPVFDGNEKEYLNKCIDSNFVSSVGEMVSQFERQVAEYTGAKHAIATVNGTAALHVSLQLAGVQRGDEVISQALTFIATCNAVQYAGAHPVFVDVDRDTMGMSPKALLRFLNDHAERRGGSAWNRNSGRRIAACVPMHTFGFPCRVDELQEICAAWGITLVEDAAESLGSFIKGKHTGTFGKLATLSFNGNKIITTGGGGMILTNDARLAMRAKHLTTTAKIAHAYEFVHDEVGYNYRLPNLNAALGCAQMEALPKFLQSKREVAQKYQAFFAEIQVPIASERAGCTANYWLNAIILESREERDKFLTYTNSRGVMTRPVWRLMPHLQMFKDCESDSLENSLWLEERIVNLPSSVQTSNQPSGIPL